MKYLLCCLFAALLFQAVDDHHQRPPGDGLVRKEPAAPRALEHLPGGHVACAPGGGVPFGGFAPNAPVTRAQLAVFLYRYAAYMGVSLHCSGELGDSYLDAAAVPDYARAPVRADVAVQVQEAVLPEEHGGHAHEDLGDGGTADFVIRLHDGVPPLAASLVEQLPSPVPQSASRVNHDAIQDAVDAAARKYGAVGVQVASIRRSSPAWT